MVGVLPVRGFRVGHPGGDRVGGFANLVAVPVGGHAGHGYRGLVAGSADEHLHAVQVAGVQARVPEADDVLHVAVGFGVDVLVDGRSGLGGREFGVMVGAVVPVPHLHVAGLFVGRVA